MEHLPLVEARKHHGVAQLIADFREMFFPQYLDPDPDEKKDSKPPRRRKPWTVADTLPPHARYPEGPPMPQGAAEALVAAYESLPAWAKPIAPITEARGVLAGG